MNLFIQEVFEAVTFKIVLHCSSVNIAFKVDMKLIYISIGTLYASL